jgi:hypothetical protein
MLPSIGIGIAMAGTACGVVGMRVDNIPTPTPASKEPVSFLLAGLGAKKSLIPPTVSTFCVNIMMYNLLVFGHAKKKRKGVEYDNINRMGIGSEWCDCSCSKSIN